VLKEQEINLVNLVERFHDEDKCRTYLEGLRWPGGLECPRCGGTTISHITTRRQLDCDSCRYRFSVTAGSMIVTFRFGNGFSQSTSL
jgi:transposase-like protein